MSSPGSAPTTAIVLPVKNGMPLLEEVLNAAAAQGADELLVVDSGSTDGSVEVAKKAGFRVIEIAPKDYGHGVTRNFAVEQTTAEIICFLTQDATPTPGWLNGYLEAFAEDEKVGLAFGPHLPRQETSPMVAREQLEFWRPFSPDQRVTIQRRIDEPGWHPEVLSNANAAYRRACIEQVKFRDINYAEDRAVVFDAMESGWFKAYAPRAAAWHAHDFPKWSMQMRRFFDEYRGLLQTSGYRTSFYPKGMWRDTVNLTKADSMWLDELGVSDGTRRRWVARAFAYHGGRRVFALLGGRSDQLPGAVQRFLSLEGKHAANPEAIPELVTSLADVETETVETKRAQPQPFAQPNRVIAEVERFGVVPLNDERKPKADADSYEITFVIPGFGPATPTIPPVLKLVQSLETLGHRCAIRIHDPHGVHRLQTDESTANWVSREYPDLKASIKVGYGDWHGSDIVVATGWEAVYPVLRLPDVGFRANLILSHDTELAADVSSRIWSEQSYRYGLQPICAGKRLGRQIEKLYGTPAISFELGLDHEHYFPQGDVAKRSDTLAVFTLPSLGWVAGPLTDLAVTELLHRRSDIRVVTFGHEGMSAKEFGYRYAGLLKPAEQARLFSEATVGLALSVTDALPVPLEMAACGLPCVTLDHEAIEGAPAAETRIVEEQPHLQIAKPEVSAIADAIEQLFDEPALRTAKAAAGIQFASGLTWRGAGEAVDTGLRAAIGSAAIKA